MSPAGRHHHHRPSFVLLIVHVCLLQRAAFTVLFPTESDDTSVHFRSLRDILFRPPNGDTSPVIASFRPALPSPTLASPSIVPNQIRFLESDAIGEPPIFTSIHSEFKSVVEGRRSTSDSSVNPAVVQDRWPWPYSSLGQAKSLQSVHPDSRSNHPNIIEKGLIVKKSVAKPYRVQSKSSSCPKLLHDLTITCSLPANHRLINQQVVSWNHILLFIQLTGIGENQTDFLSLLLSFFLLRLI